VGPIFEEEGSVERSSPCGGDGSLHTSTEAEHSRGSHLGAATRREQGCLAPQVAGGTRSIGDHSLVAT
jgi:hypothetical protein